MPVTLGLHIRTTRLMTEPVLPVLREMEEKNLRFFLFHFT